MRNSDNMGRARVREQVLGLAQDVGRPQDVPRPVHAAAAFGGAAPQQRVLASGLLDGRLAARAVAARVPLPHGDGQDPGEGVKQSAKADARSRCLSRVLAVIVVVEGS